jgi:hypothetical protein
MLSPRTRWSQRSEPCPTTFGTPVRIRRNTHEWSGKLSAAPSLPLDLRREPLLLSPDDTHCGAATRRCPKARTALGTPSLTSCGRGLECRHEDVERNRSVEELQRMCRPGPCPEGNLRHCQARRPLCPPPSRVFAVFLPCRLCVIGADPQHHHDSRWRTRFAAASSLSCSEPTFG